jgi:membrane protein implicated in regulation of membrane protease activity
MLGKIKSHFSNRNNLAFWLLFGPAIFMTLLGVHELYTKYFDLLTFEDHIQFLIRFFFPVSLATLVTVLERRQRKQKEDLIRRGHDYLRRKRSTK